MVTLTKGFAGSGKTTKLIEDLCFLVETNGVEPYSTLILTISSQEKRELENRLREKNNIKATNVMTIEEFCSHILNKSPYFFSNKILTDSDSIEIVAKICKTDFAGEYALKNLTKSNSFFRELYNLFALLKNNEITPDAFDKAIENCNPNQSDKKRLKIFKEVFCKYNSTIKENNCLDYRDLISCAYTTVLNDSLLKSATCDKFKYILVDGVENITILQFKLLKLISEKCELKLYGDEYSRTSEFRGCWTNSLNTKELEQHLGDIKEEILSSYNRNDEVIKRATHLVKKYNGEEEARINFEASSNIDYRLFDDIQDEISYIAKDILKKKESGNCNFSDFAVLIRDYESKQKFIDLFKSYAIPISSDSYCNEYQNFKIKLLRYLHLCAVLKKLGIKNFNFEEFKNITNISKAQKEACIEELNLYLQNIVSDVLKDCYQKDQFVLLEENSAGVSLIDVIYQNINILKETDRQKLQKELLDLAEIYKLYLNSKFTNLAVFIAKKSQDSFDNDTFSKIFAKLLTKLNSLESLHTSILNDNPSASSVIDLINSPIELTSNDDNSVKLLTFFKSIGQEFKFVYIPALEDNSFPKSNKSTYFITPDTNEKISEELRKQNTNFKTLIELDSNSVKEEARLFYVGMTRAKSYLLISSHKYEDKKETQPSIFFQTLCLIDKENFSKQEKIENSETVETVNFEDTQPIFKQEEAVIGKDENLMLSYSAISNYSSCPRKYFYKNLLGIKEKGTFSANYGNALHAVMEVFNNSYLKNYTKDSLTKLATILFDSKNDPQAALEKGFKKQIIELIEATDELSITEMRANFIEAAQNLEENGFFDEVPLNVTTEKSFSFELENIEKTKFEGRIDAISQTSCGYEIIDYKSGKNKKKKLAAILNESMIESKDFDYQIPMYYLACQNSNELKEFKDKISKLGLNYIRPPFKDNGFERDMVDTVMVESIEKQIKESLKTNVVEKIREEVKFSQLNSKWDCEKCAFANLCDEEDENGD